MTQVAVDNKRVLALFPHPDDMEILCAGTLIRLCELGMEVHVATMTPGDKGTSSLSPLEIAAERRAEARHGAQLIGAKSFTCLEFRDVEIVFDNASRRTVAEFLRTMQPTMVLTTPPDDYMFDHEITSCLVRDACFNAPIPNYDTGGSNRAIEQVPHLYYTDAVEGRTKFGGPSRATCVVDISMQIDRKAAALECHQSQRGWLTTQHGVSNYIEAMREWSSRRGTQIGVDFAEAFCMHRGHAYPQDDKLSALLGAVQIPLSAGDTV